MASNAKDHIVIFILLCIMAFGAGYWHSSPKGDSDERAEVVPPPAPTVVTNVVTNTLKEVVADIVTVPQPTPVPTPPAVKPRPTPTLVKAQLTPTPHPVKTQPTTPNTSPANMINPIIEAAVRTEHEKPTGEITKADLEKVTILNLNSVELTEVTKGLEKLTQLKILTLTGTFTGGKLEGAELLEKLTHLGLLYLTNNNLTEVKSLKNLTQLKILTLIDNPELTKAQIDELQKALPDCAIYSNPTN